MARIVMKFGGTSMAGTERIRRVAGIVQRQRAAGHEVAVVVSAMAGETDRLVGFCREASPMYDPAEYDVVVAAGEQVTAGLLALTLQAMGVPARSWLGWQLPIRTDDAHSKARIEGMDAPALTASLARGEVAVIPGFQGLAGDGRVTTLGRGGSDTSAVAVAAALKADRCDIYTDVDGVYTTDPRITKQAQRIARVSYEEMLEMASLGAKVLQTRSVELAMAYKVPVRVLSSFEPPDAPSAGTLICDEDDIMEKQIVSAVTLSKDEAKISLLSVPDEPGRAAMIFGLLAEAGINIDMIVQSPSRQAGANISFTMAESELARAVEALTLNKDKIGYVQMQSDRNVVKVSVIGVGMRSHTGVASTMFRALGDKSINIQNISTSEIKISVLIAADYGELAVRTLHQAYGLDRTESAA